MILFLNKKDLFEMKLKKKRARAARQTRTTRMRRARRTARRALCRVLRRRCVQTDKKKEENRAAEEKKKEENRAAERSREIGIEEKKMKLEEKKMKLEERKEKRNEKTLKSMLEMQAQLLKKAGIFGVVDFDEDQPLAPQLKDALSKNAMRVIDLFREWDANGDGEISKKEFREAMPRLGFELPKEAINGLFDEYDPDGTGVMDFKELQKMLKPTPKPPAMGKLKAVAKMAALAK